MIETKKISETQITVNGKLVSIENDNVINLSKEIITQEEIDAALEYIEKKNNNIKIQSSIK